MSGSVNKVFLVGRLGRDPETRTTNAGTQVVTFSLATSESWRDKATGERREQTEWHDIVIFNESLGKIAEQYCRKGHLVQIEGMQCTRTYKDRDGIERRRTETVLKQFRGALTLLERSERPAPDPASYGKTSSRPSQDVIDDARMGMAPPRSSELIDDDVPF